MTNVLENNGLITKRRNEELKENGILKQDVIFDAPSTAAAFAIGWIEWKDEKGLSLKIKKIDTVRKKSE